MKLIFFCIFFAISNYSFEQDTGFDSAVDTMNIIYLSSFCQQIDSSYACFKIHPFKMMRDPDLFLQSFNEDFRSYDMNYYGEKNYEIGKPVYLNGLVIWFNEEEIIRENFVNGSIQALEKIKRIEGDTIAYTYYKFDSLYMNQAGSYYYKEQFEQVNESGFYYNGKNGWDFYPNYDSRGEEFIVGKFPYLTGLVPPFLGLVAGLEGFRNNGYEIGVAVNISEVSGDIWGGMGGFILTYKNRFDDSYHSLGAEFGVYSPISLGFGFIYNSNGNYYTNCFRLITGVTLFHIQFLYSYNFYSNKKNQITDLYHHAFSLRLALPVWRF